MSRSVVLIVLAVSVIGGGHSISAERSIRVVSAERALTFGSRGSFIAPQDRNSVVLVLTIRGFSEDEWNRLPLSRFTVSSGGRTFYCQLRTVMSLRPEDSVSSLAPNSALGDPRLVFLVPKEPTSFTLRFRDEPPIPFSSSPDVKSTLR